MPDRVILVERHGAVAHVVLNRMRWDDAVVEALGEGLLEVESATWCRTLLLPIAGTASCARSDKVGQLPPRTRPQPWRDSGLAVRERLLHHPKPTLAAVHGSPSAPTCRSLCPATAWSWRATRS